MIAFIALCYSSLYFLIFNKLGLLKKTIGNIAAFAGVGVVLIAGVIFMWYTFSPMSSDARMFRYIIPIVPNVKGEVVDVPIQAMEPVAKGDTLFKIDPDPYRFTVRQLEAQQAQQEADWRLAQANVERAEELVAKKALSQVELDIWLAKLDAATAAIEGTKAQLDMANWNLDETDVQAPVDGYVINLQLRPGNYVTTMPLASSMAFVSDEVNSIVSSFSQSAIRRIAVGDKAEIVFRKLPGQVFSGEVTRVVGFSSEAQLSASGQLPTLSGAPDSSRWAVMVDLDDVEFAKQLPQGTAGTLAVYTDAGKPVHVISKVALRMSAWMGYLTSP